MKSITFFTIYLSLSHRSTASANHTNILATTCIFIIQIQMNCPTVVLQYWGKKKVLTKHCSIQINNQISLLFICQIFRPFSTLLFFLKHSNVEPYSSAPVYLSIIDHWTRSFKVCVNRNTTTFKYLKSLGV